MRWSRLVLRNVGQRPGRTAVSVASVAIGVTVFLATSIATRDLRETIESAGDFGLDNTVTLSPTGVFDAYAPRSALEPLRSLPDVAFVAGALSTQAVLDADGDRHPLALVAWGAPADVVAGRLPSAGAAEIALASDEIAALGQTVRLDVLGSGVHEVAVVGVVGGDGPGPYAVTTHESLRSWMGVDDVVDQVVVGIADGVDADDWAEDHRAELGPFQETSGFFGSDAVEFFRSVDESLTPLAMSSLFVAGYLIFLTLGRAVQDRAMTIATLRAIGTGRRQLVGLVLGEAAVIGIAGTGIGLISGSVLSRSVTAALRNVFGVEIAGDGAVSLPATVVLVAVVLGLVTPLVAAAIPAALATRTDPAQHLRGDIERVPSAQLGRLVGGATAFAAGTIATVLVTGSAKTITILVALAGAAVGLPIIGRPIAELLGRGWSRLRPGPGELAAQEMARRPGRSAQSTALLAAILMVTVIVATISASQRPAFVRAVNAHYGGDADVHETRGNWLSDDHLAALAADPDVVAVSPAASGTVSVVERGGRSELLRVIDVDTYFAVADIPWANGTDSHAAVAGLRRGDTVIATAVAQRIGVDVGDQIRLQTLHGPQAFRVAGLFHGLGFGETVSVTVNDDVARAAFGLRGTPFVRVHLRDGVDLRAWAAKYPGAFIEPTAEIRSTIMAASDGITNMAYVILVVTVLVGVLGLANTLAMDMLDRRREIGVLRALGLQRREVRAMVRSHSMVLTIVAGILAVALGSILGRAFVGDGSGDNLTLPLQYAFPTRIVPAILLSAVVVGTIAAATPARIASRMQPTDALRLPVET